MRLVIGNKNYSSWSLRPWIAMTMANIPFDEVLIPLYEPGSREKVLAYSPAGKVPILIDDIPSEDIVADGWDPRILGIFQGTPLPERTSGYGNNLPDVITIFQRPIEEDCQDEDEIRAEVRAGASGDRAGFPPGAGLRPLRPPDTGDLADGVRTLAP